MPGGDTLADRELVARCVAGDGQAWQQLVEAHESTVYFAIRSALTLRDRASSDELVRDLQSEVFYRLVRRGGARLASYSGRCSLKHWLKVVAGNFVIDYLRKRRADCSLDDPVQAPLRESLPAREPTPEAALEHRQRRALLRELWNRLSAEDRRFVELYYVDELGFAEVAEAMRTSVAATYTRKNRVTAKLRAALRRHQRRAKGNAC